MADYKKMYLRLAKETERAVRILIAAQQECEEMYISAPETKLIELEPVKKETDTLQEAPPRPVGDRLTPQAQAVDPPTSNAAPTSGSGL